MKKSFIAYFLLVSSILIPLSFIIPHHHHSDGTFCFSLTQAEETQHETEGHHESSHCTCNGHNQATYTTVQSHLTGGSIWLFLIPLETLFSYTSPSFLLSDLALLWRRALYTESLHDFWIAKAVGLRAPPSVVL